MKYILAKKIPLYFFIIATGLLSLIIYHLYDTAAQAKLEIQEATAPASQPSAKLEEVCLQDYALTKPLLMSEVLNESENLKGLKRALNFEIGQLKASGIVSEASIYVKRLNDGEWTSVNNTSEYAPGSIIKVAAMITYLKMCEQDPSKLNREFLFTPRKGVPAQTFNDEPMVPGKKYSAKELLRRVIINSDNNATLIINEALDLNIFKKLFTDLGMPEPNIHDPNFKMDVIELSKFLGILYNATYLNKENSEYALALMSQSSFTKGIVSGLPIDTKVAHKFGETGNASEAQLHETAIVYVDNDPYLITIMTKGKNVHLLPEALSDLSKITYQKMKSDS